MPSDGAPVARVRLLLSEPAEPEVRSERNTIQVDLSRRRRAGRVARCRGAVRGQPAPQAATRIEGIAAAPEGSVEVTLKGNGPLVAGLERADAREALPPRPGFHRRLLRSRGATPVNKGPIQRIRVATHSAQAARDACRLRPVRPGHLPARARGQRPSRSCSATPMPVAAPAAAAGSEARPGRCGSEGARDGGATAAGGQADASRPAGHAAARVQPRGAAVSRSGEKSRVPSRPQPAVARAAADRRRPRRSPAMPPPQLPAGMAGLVDHAAPGRPPVQRPPDQPRLPGRGPSRRCSASSRWTPA